MKTRTIDNICDMLCAEIDKIADRKEITRESLDTLHKLTDTYKNVLKIEMLENNEYSGNSRYDDDYSNMHRSERHEGRSHRHSRSNSRERFRTTLEEMMDDVTSDSDRDVIKRCMAMLRD